MDQTPLDWLFSLAQFGIKFGLENIDAIVAALGHPERQYRSAHVAGTNGKGSVTAMVETALRLAGHRTGRYTSPHLLDLNERFAINGAPVNQAEMLAAVATVRQVVERLRADGTLAVHPTFFEVTTATGFELFRRHEVDVAVCEVGLGGRLDATNVLSPMVSAITSIGFDHEQYLGRTLGAIAFEKAGIIKPGTPVVAGPVDADAAAVIASTAHERGAPLIWAMEGVVIERALSHHDDGGQRFALRTPDVDYGTVRLALAGDHQVANACVAVRLLERLDAAGLRVGREHVIGALDCVVWPGRLETVRLPDEREALLDAAHNDAGAEALAQHLGTEAPRPLVFAAMRDKDVTAMLRRLAPRASKLIVTRASNPRSAEPSDIEAIARRVAPALTIEIAGTPAEALALAWSTAPRIVVAGSIFLLADVMKTLGRS